MRSSVHRRTDETEQVHRRADSRDRQGGRSGTEGRGSLSYPRHHRADVLPLEGTIRRHGTERDAAPQAARGRESAIEADRFVTDRTGLMGRYDFRLEYSPGFPEPRDAVANTGPSLFTALTEQLGLS